MTKGASANGSGFGCRCLGIGLALMFLNAGCWSTDSPEAQVRATITQAETLAEAKDLGGLKDLVSDVYRDDGGHDKRAIMGLLFLHFRRHESIHLLTRIDHIDVHAPGQAVATVFSAMAGRPVSTVADLPALRADLYRFDLTFSDERGTWRVTTSTWRPAVLTDFLPPGTDG